VIDYHQQLESKQRKDMREFKGNNLQARRENAEKAKQAVRKLAQAMPKPGDPEFIARQAELKAIADAREARAAERVAAKERAERERIEKEAAEAAQREAEARRLAEQQAAEKAALAAQQKAERDARYAARKKRKK
jgi:hypothetical protein